MHGGKHLCLKSSVSVTKVSKANVPAELFKQQLKSASHTSRKGGKHPDFVTVFSVDLSTTQESNLIPTASHGFSSVEIVLMFCKVSS